MKLLPVPSLPLALVACGAPPTGGDAPSHPLEVRPYLWAASVDGEGPSGGGGDPIDLDLIGLEDLEWAMMVAVELQPPETPWGLVVDSFYTRFDQDDSLIHTELEASILELAVTHEGWQLQPMVGLRAWDLSLDVDLPGLGSPEREETWVDPVLGLRGAWPLGRGWSAQGQVDAGGFGLQAEHTIQAQAAMRYATSRRGLLHFGYRHLEVEFLDFDLDISLSGPFLGFSWTF